MKSRAVLTIDIVRYLSLGLSLLLALPALLLGTVAFADYRDRGCFVGEAMQCSDARTMMAMAVAAVLTGPAVWAALTFARKWLAVREGEINA